MNVLRKILIVLLSLVFIFSAYKIITIYKGYSDAEKIYDDSRSSFMVVEDDEDKEAEAVREHFPFVEIDFDSLLAENPDVLGWIWIPGMEVNYPLVQGETNDTYLYTSYNHISTSNGSIFMNSGNAGDFSDDNTIIYGHNMKNNAMFGSLKNYKDQEFFKEHQMIYIFTPDKVYKYGVFSCYETPSNSDTYITNYGGNITNAAYLKLVSEQSLITSDIVPEEGDPLLLLSTCTSNRNNRLVVHGALLAVKDLTN